MNSTDFGQLVGPIGMASKKELLRKYKVGGKVAVTMGEFKRGNLHSGSKRGPVVKSRKQAIAIALSEQRKTKYASGGAVSWWDLLQRAIRDLGPQSPLQDNGSVNQAAQAVQNRPAQVAQATDTVMRRGGRVK